jgi:hypothetical protein
MFRDYKIAYDCNENNALLKHDLTKQDLVILDRGYASFDLFNDLKKKTKFLVRLRSNFNCVKEFMDNKNINTKIVTEYGTRLKLVKYWIDKQTQKIIFDKYNEEKTFNDDDLSECFVLATNDVKLSIDDCVFLYKKRWTIETAFKQLKQHFKLRYVNKQITMISPLKKSEFWFKMSFFMFNMTSILKNCIDKNQKDECKFSECVIFLRDFMSGRLNEDNIMSDLEHLQKQKQYIRNTERVNQRNMKKGTYKSVNTIDRENEKYDIINNCKIDNG